MAILNLSCSIFLVSGLSNTVFAQTSIRDSTVKLIEKARKANFKESIKLLDEAIKTDPHYTQPYLMKARMFCQKGDLANGFFWFDKAIEQDSVNILGYRGWYKFYYTRDYEGCIQDLEKVKAMTPKYSAYPGGDHIYYLLGAAETELKNYDKALFYFEKYITEIRESKGEEWLEPLTYTYLGKINIKQKKIEEAIGYFDKCLKLFPKSPEALYLKGIILKNMGHKEDAFQCFTKSAELFNAKYADRWFHIDEYRLELSDIQEKIESCLIKK